MLREDLDDLRSASASSAVRLLPGRDPWVMAPGTRTLASYLRARRELGQPVGEHGASARRRGRHLVRPRERLDVVWFHERGRVPRAALEQEAESLAGFLDRSLDLTVAVG